MSKKDVKKYMPEIIKHKVSEKARSKSGFTYKYLNNKLDQTMLKKRRLFIARTLPAYRKNKTYRRKLSLIAWAFYPD